MVEVRRKLVSLAAVLLIVAPIILSNVNALTQVPVGFQVRNVWWGTYQNQITPEPGDKNVPLTVVIRQQSELYLRGVAGYLNLTEYFRDSYDNDNVSSADAVAIETDNDAGDIIPFGSFYFTFYLDISENATKGEYLLNLRITGYAYNNTSYYEIMPTDLTIKVIIDNRPPEVRDKNPDSNTVTVYLNETETFSVDADDPDGDSLNYKWLLDDNVVLSGPNATEYTFNASEHGRGTYILEVEINDGEDTTKVSWTVDVPNRAPEIRDRNPSDNTVSLYAGDNRTFSVSAEDPDGDNITYTWYLDGKRVLSGANATNYTYCANESDVGSHTLRVEVSDGEDTTSTTWTINVDVTSATEVKTVPEYVYAGKKYNVTIIIWNNIWQGTVDIDISYPEYVAMFSDTHWTFRDVQPNESVAIPLEMYVPSEVLTSFGEVSLIGQTLSLSLDISFVDRYGRSHQESRSAEFIIRGEIDLRLFSKSVEPEKITPGDVVSVSVTVLNVGVSSAQYANASVVPADFIELLAESFTYIGEIEPGAPIPIILKFKVKENVTPGTYSVEVKICYFDDVYNEHYILVLFTFNVTEKQEQSTEHTSESNIEEYLTAIYVGGIIATAIVAFIAIKRRRPLEERD